MVFCHMKPKLLYFAVICCKLIRSRRFIFVLVFGTIVILSLLHLHFYFDDYKDDCSRQIDINRQWQYKNGVDGTWYCWSNTNSHIHKQGWKVKWFNQPPVDYLGVIIYLAQQSKLHKLNMSLLSLRQYLQKPRPVVIFHEDDLNDVHIQQSLANTLGSNIPLGFEHIRLPTQTDIAHGNDRYPLGYHHMCRFFAIMLPYHPLLTNMFSFYWRLDSDSHLLGPSLTDDLFDYMKENHLQYAFSMVEVDAPKYVRGLWKLFRLFLTRFCLTPSASVRRTQTSFFGEGYSFSVFYNNLEVANASIWRDDPYIAAWLRHVDEAGGIYYHRWGDAPIHTLAVTQFIERNKVIKLRDFGYFHRREYVCAEGVYPCAVPSHLEASANRPFPNGCHPTRNSLCYYYPEKKLK